MSTAPLTREEIFRNGLKGATGAITFWTKKSWGTVTLDGPEKIEYFTHKEHFPESQHQSLATGVRVQFDAAPNQIDPHLSNDRWGKPRKPAATNCSVIVPEETNFNR